MAYRILIVDDEAALQNMVREILAQAGYDTASALTCAQALERFQAAPPDACCRRRFSMSAAMPVYRLPPRQRSI